MVRNVTAFTEPHAPPAGEVVGYVSINASPAAAIGTVEITVRDRQGGQAAVVVPALQWRRMIAEAAGDFARGARLQ